MGDGEDAACDPCLDWWEWGRCKLGKLSLRFNGCPLAVAAAMAAAVGLAESIGPVAAPEAADDPA